MLITKVLETSIDLFLPEDIYALDVKKLLINKLTERYANKCYSSILILKIIEIIRYSDRIMVNNRLDGAAYLDVTFKVEGMILTKGEVVQGCKIVNITSFRVIVQHPHVVGMMTQDLKKKAITILQKDQIVPVIVEDARYNLGLSQISITCKPYIPQPFPEVFYNITSILSLEDTEKIDSILKELEDEQKLHLDIKQTKAYEKFSDLLYPYKTVRKFHLSPVGSKFDPLKLELKEILKIRDGCITNVDLNVDEFVVHSKNTVNFPELQIINGPLYPALSSILYQKIQFMKTLREFIEQYDTVDKNKPMLAYWKVCTDLKD